MYADNEYLFVLTAIEYADAPALGQTARSAPQKIVIQIHFGRLFEIEDLATRRIYATHYGPNRAVFAARVHALENDEQGVAVARPEDPLQIVEPFDCRLESLFHSPLFRDRRMGR